MIGVDLSVRPTIWAVLHKGAWITDELPDTPEAPQLLRTALDRGRVWGRRVALCLPPREVAHEPNRPLKGIAGRQAVQAARLAAARVLGEAPDRVQISLTSIEDGFEWVAAQRAGIEDRMRPWLEAGFQVPVVEPSATTALRAQGSREVQVLVVRTGRGSLEVVAGSTRRLLVARSMLVDWENVDAGVASEVVLEIQSTIITLRNDGHEPRAIALGGLGDILRLKGLFEPLLPVEMLRLHADFHVVQPPSEAVVAAAVSLWGTSLAGERQPARGGPGLAALLRRLGGGTFAGKGASS